MDLDLEDLWLQGKASTDIGISGTNDFNTNSGTFSPFEIDFSNSKLNSLIVTPSTRQGSVKWANCVQ